jgi:peptidoglycan/xylan/chitin deacetylase (PgdA/CDA1 family)
MFEQHMRFLARNYRVVSMADVLAAYQQHVPLPPRSVLITIDDAYCDVATNAWPILKRYQLPATLFVPTAFPAGQAAGFWWDRVYQAVAHAAPRGSITTPLGQLAVATPAEQRQASSQINSYIKSLPHREALAWVDRFCAELQAPPPQRSVLSWPELRALASEGLALGAHTRTHPLMKRIAGAEIDAEVAGSLHDLVREVPAALPVFAYPSGSVSVEAVQALERAGAALAFTTHPGFNDLRQPNRLRIQRIDISGGTTLAVLRTKLLPAAMPLYRSSLRMTGYTED